SSSGQNEFRTASTSDPRVSAIRGCARAAMDDVRAELQAAEEEARQQATSLRQRARRLRLRGFGELADELEAHAVALHETANAVAAQLESFASGQRIGVARSSAGP